MTAVGFYGMSTFEGPVMSIKAVNSLSPLHRLDDRPRPFRRAGLGRFHRLRHDVLPRARACGTEAAWSTRLIGWHYWIATVGIVLYITAMWVSASCRA